MVASRPAGGRLHAEGRQPRLFGRYEVGIRSRAFPQGTPAAVAAGGQIVSPRRARYGGSMALEDFLYPLLRYYLEAPSWLRAPAAARAYAWLPRVVRWGGAYDTVRNEIASSQGEAAGRLALQKLGENLRWAIQTVPAYCQFRALLARH